MEQDDQNNNVQDPVLVDKAGTEEVQELSEPEKIQKAISEGVERALREVQSAKDKALREVQSGINRHPAPAVNNQFGYLQEELRDLDPDVAKDVELATLRAQARITSETQTANQRVSREENFKQEFMDSLISLAESAGIDPKDKTLDWAEDAGTDYLTRMKRFQASVVGTLRVKIDGAKGEGAAAAGAAQIEERRKAGLESHDTSHAGGNTAVLTDEAFLEAFSTGEAPMTKENKARAQALINKSDKLLI